MLHCQPGHKWESSLSTWLDKGPPAYKHTLCAALPANTLVYHAGAAGSAGGGPQVWAGAEHHAAVRACVCHEGPVRLLLTAHSCLMCCSDPMHWHTLL